MIEKTVKVTNKGMISIPAVIRKKHCIHDGDHVILREEEDGAIRIITIETIESLRKRALTVKEFEKIYKRSIEEDLEVDE